MVHMVDTLQMVHTVRMDQTVDRVDTVDKLQELRVVFHEPEMIFVVSLRDSRRGHSRQQKLQTSHRDVEIRVRSVRFTPRGFETKR